MIKRKAKKELVSPETRKVLWIQFTDIYQKKNLYANLGALETTPDFLEIIDKDLNRTQVAKGVKEKAREVLTRFAIYNPYIGYCQGMNHIVAFLLE